MPNRDKLREDIEDLDYSISVYDGFLNQDEDTNEFGKETEKLIQEREKFENETKDLIQERENLLDQFEESCKTEIDEASKKIDECLAKMKTLSIKNPQFYKNIEEMGKLRTEIHEVNQELEEMGLKKYKEDLEAEESFQSEERKEKESKQEKETKQSEKENQETDEPKKENPTVKKTKIEKPQSEQKEPQKKTGQSNDKSTQENRKKLMQVVKELLAKVKNLVGMGKQVESIMEERGLDESQKKFGDNLSKWAAEKDAGKKAQEEGKAAEQETELEKDDYGKRLEEWAAEKDAEKKTQEERKSAEQETESEKDDYERKLSEWAAEKDAEKKMQDGNNVTDPEMEAEEVLYQQGDVEYEERNAIEENNRPLLEQQENSFEVAPYHYQQQEVGELEDTNIIDVEGHWVEENDEISGNQPEELEGKQARNPKEKLTAQFLRVAKHWKDMKLESAKTFALLKTRQVQKFTNDTKEKVVKTATTTGKVVLGAGAATVEAMSSAKNALAQKGRNTADNLKEMLDEGRNKASAVLKDIDDRIYEKDARNMERHENITYLEDELGIE